MTEEAVGDKLLNALLQVVSGFERVSGGVIPDSVHRYGPGVVDSPQYSAILVELVHRYRGWSQAQ